MEELIEYTEISIGRGNMYSFLGHIYKVEVDEELISLIHRMEFPSEGSNKFIEGFEMIRNYIKFPILDPLTDLAVDYAKVFLGAGKTESESCAYPYESVYTSPERLIMQDARDDVLAKYREYGLDRSEDCNEPEDHIFFELEFMGVLCKQTHKSIIAEDNSAVLSCLVEQKNFIEQHLLNWVPRFCNDIEKYAETDFYKGIAKVTEAFIKMDIDITDELISIYSS